jgi:hypothetical protein
VAVAVVPVRLVQMELDLSQVMVVQVLQQALLVHP